MKNTSSRQSKVNKKSAISSLRLALESRLLFDGAIMATANDVAQLNAEQKETSTDTSQHSDFDFKSLGLDISPLAFNPSAEEVAAFDKLVASTSASVTANSAVSTLVIVDSRSAEGRALIETPPLGSRVVLLDGSQEGFQQVANQLGGWHEISQLHIVPAVVDGVPMLGGTALNAIGTQSVANVLADWGDGLADNAHVVFHGEHIAAESSVLLQVDVMTGAQSSWVRDVTIADQPANTTVVFIDTSVSNPAAIVAATPANAEIVYLYDSQDGVSQMADYLQGRTGIDSIQIVSHGGDGKLFLGNSTVSSDNLSVYADKLAQIGQSLTVNGDILLYGCDVAQTWVGQQFVSSIADLTGADVAASTDTTGAADLGGNWVLEDQVGVINTLVVTAPAWHDTLAPTNSGAWTVSGSTASNVTAGITTTISFVSNSANSSFTGLTGTGSAFNTIPVFSNSADGDPSLSFVFNWDTSPEPTTALPMTQAATDSGTGTVTINFSRPVTNPIINLDRFGGFAAFTLTDTLTGAIIEQDSRSNSSLWTLITPGATLTKVTGVNHLEVTSTTIQRTPSELVSTAYVSESGINSFTNTAAGSIRVNGTFTTISFQLSGVGAEGGGADGIEIGVIHDQTPIIDLNSTGAIADIARDFSATYIKGTAPVKVADIDADVFDGGENDLTTLTIKTGGVVDAGAEVTSIGGISFPLNTSSTQTVTVGATTFSVALDAGTGEFTITKQGGGITPQADLDLLVRSITYNNTSNTLTAGDRTLTFQLVDSTGQPSNPAISTIHVPINNAPVNTLPATAYSTAEDTILNLTGLSITDVDAGTGIVTVTLAVDNGTLTSAGNASVAVTGSGTSSMTLSGTVANINAVLASATASIRPQFVPTPDFNGAVTLTMTTDDGGNTGTGGPLQDIDTKTITVTAVADILANAITTNEDTQVIIPVLVNDSFENPVHTITAIAGTPVIAGDTVTVPNGKAKLEADGTITFMPDADVSGSSVFSYTVTSGGVNETANATVTITAVPDAPRVDLDTTTTGTDYATSYRLTQSAVVIGNLVSVTDPDTANLNTMTVTISDHVAGDTLKVVGTLPVGLILTAYNPATGTLTITSSSPQANYQAALDLIHFSTTALDDGNRSIAVSVVSTAAPTASNVAVTTVAVLPQIAFDDSYTVQPAKTVNIDPKTNDFNPGAGTLVITTIVDPAQPGTSIPLVAGTPVTLASGTTVTLKNDGTLDVKMGPGSNDTETFDYLVSDGLGNIDTATVTLNRDTDGDGIKNIIDIDNDNDGILDTVEERPGKFDIADFSGWTAGSLTGTAPMPNGGTVAINTAFSYSPGAYVSFAGYPVGTTAPELATFVGQSEFNAAFPDGLLGPTSGLTIFTGTAAASPVEHQISLDFTNTTAGVANEYTVFGVSGIYPDWLTVYDAKVTITAIKADGTLETNYTGWDAVNPDAGYGGVDANGAILDTALESATATPTGFVLDPANIATYTGNQDLVPVLIKLPAGSAYKTIIITREKLGTGADTEYMTLYLGEHTLPPDSDGDGLIDALDIDSDNDGITDNVEAQTTVDYIAPSGMPSAGFIDVNQDGLDDNYDKTSAAGITAGATGVGLTPVNTDNADKVDYLDTNSDNDTLTDAQENGFGLPVQTGLSTAATDADGDGLFDVFESGSSTDGFDVNDQNLDVTDTNFTLPKDVSLLADGSNAMPLAKDLLFRDLNIPPVAVNDGPIVTQTGVVKNINVLANDRDVDLDPLSVTAIYDPAAPLVAIPLVIGTPVTFASGTTVTLKADGTFDVLQTGVVPDTETFKYAISDSAGGSATATVTLTLDTDSDGVANMTDIDDDNDGVLDGVEFNRAEVQDFLVGSDNAGHLYKISDVLGTPTVTLLSTTPIALGDIGYRNDGRLYGTDYSTDAMRWYEINPSTGAMTLINTFYGDIRPASVAFYGDFAYVGAGSSSPSSNIYRVDPDTGSFTLWHHFGSGGSAGDTLFINDKAYTSWYVGGAVHLYEITIDANNDYVSHIDLGVVSNTSLGLGADINGNIFSIAGGGASNISQITFTSGVPNSVSETLIPGLTWTGNMGWGLTGRFEGGLAGLDTDSDNDGIVDRLDIDKDNDGITDNVEAQTTKGYIAPSGMPGAGFIDVNQDGLDDNYDNTTAVGIAAGATGVGLTPVNTDGTDNPDYLDLDSDNDLAPDVAERGDTQPITAVGVTADTDKDGLLDIFEAGSVSDGYDVNDQNLDVTNTNFNLAKATLLNADGSNAIPIIKDLAFRGINNPPVAVDDNFTTKEDTSVILLNLVGNDTDFDEDVLSVKSINGTDLIPNTAQTITVPNGTVTVDVAGVITFNPTANYNGPASFDYVVQDGLGGVDTGTINITIAPVNDAPAGADKTITTLEDTAHTFTAADFGFTDLLDAPTPNSFKSVIITTLPTSGTLTLLGAPVGTMDEISAADIPNLIWTPDLNSNGVGLASFNFQVVDNGGTANSGQDTDQSANTITIDVTPVNDRPTLVAPASINVTEDVASVISGLVFSDVDAGTASVLATLAVPVGSLSAASGNGVTVGGTATSLTLTGTLADINAFIAASKVTYTTALNAVADVTLTATINDQGNTGLDPNTSGTATNEESSTTVTLVVTSVNDAPAGTDKTVTTLEDTAYHLTVADFGFTDPNDTPANSFTSVIITTLPANGTLSLANVAVTAGQLVSVADISNLVWTPDLNANGAGLASFTFKVVDDGGTASGGQDTDQSANTITFDVTPVDDAPVEVVPLAQNTGINTPISIPGLSVSDVDANGSTETVTLSVGHGTLTLGSIAGLSFATGDGTADGTMTFTGTLADINTAIASVTYTPANNFYGFDTLTFTTNDNGNTGVGGPLSITETVDLTVFPPPIANDDSFITSEDLPVTIMVVGNDSDPAALPFKVTEVNNTPITTGTPGVPVTGGVVTLDASGNLVFTPNLDYNGSPSFTYTIADAYASATATVTGLVTPVNDAPVNTVPATYEAVVGTPMPITGVSIADIDAGTADVKVTLGVEKGTLALLANVPGGLIAAQITGNGTDTIEITAPLSVINTTLAASNGLLFTPLANAFGLASFAVITNDLGNTGTGGELSDLDTALINIDRLPIAVDDSFTTDEDTLVVIPVKNNDSDPDGDTLTITKIGTTAIVVGTPVAVTNGSVTLNADGTLSFTPAPNYSGSVSFTYTISDGHGGLATANVTGTIIAVNDPPVAVNDVNVVVEDIPTTGNVILPNDTDIDSLALNVTQFTIAGDTTIYSADATATIPNVGTLQIKADGSYTFTPALDYNGPVPVATYTITDNNGGNASATLTLGPVSPVNDAPVAQNDTGTTPEDTSLTVPALTGLLANDSDVDGPALAVTTFTVNGIVAPFTAGATATIPNVGTLKINSDGAYTFTPVADYYGSVPLVTYIVSDGAEETSATLALTVTPVNDPPILDLDGAVAGSGFVATFTENGAGVSLSAPSALVTDVDDTVMESATIVLTNAQLGDMLVAGTLPAGITASAYNPTTGTITLSGTATKADYAAAINAITFVATNDMPSTVDRLIDVTVSDGDNNSNTATTTVHVIAVDDAPVNNLPAVFTMAAGGTVNLSGISLSDPDAGSGVMTVIFSTKINNVGVGSLHLDTTVPGGITAAQVTGNGTSSITINASLAEINATLASAHGLDFNAPVGLTPVSFVMSSNDNGNAGINGPKTDFDVRTIMLTPPPVATNDSATTNEETSVSISVLTNDLLGGSGSGSLTITDVGGLPIVAGGAPVPVANGTVTLGLDGKLTFQPAPDFNGQATFSYTIDNGENGTATGVVLVNVTPVNDAPAGTDSTITTLEDNAHSFTAADFGFTDPIDAPTPNSFQSVIITTLPTNGTLSLANVAVTAGQAVSVTDIANLIWTPDLNSNGNGLTSFTFQVVDDGGMLLGNKDTDLSPNTISLNVTPVNDDPVLSLDPNNSGGGANDNGYAFPYIENSIPITVVDTDAIFNDVGEGDLITLNIVVADVISNTEESITIAGHVFALNQTVSTAVNATIGGTTVAMTFNAGTQTFTIVNAVSGVVLPPSDLGALIQGMRYEHTGETPTAGDRTLTFTVTDSSNATSVPVVSKVTVVPVNDTPVVAIKPVIKARDIVVVDMSVPNIEKLLNSIPAGAKVIKINVGEHGVAKLANALAGLTGINSIHFLAHGEVTAGNNGQGLGNIEGSFNLGVDVLNSTSISGVYAQDLAKIGAVLSETGDILVYGCNFGQDAEAVDALAAVTGADVAASIDNTGAATLGGDWKLENTTGVIEAKSISATKWNGLLAPNRAPVAPDSLVLAPTEFGTGLFGAPIVTAAGGNVLQAHPGDTALYSNIGTYDGIAVDMKITYQSTTATAGYVEFGNNIDVARIRLQGATGAATTPATHTMLVEFFVSGTNTPTAFSGPLNFSDIDWIGHATSGSVSSTTVSEAITLPTNILTNVLKTPTTTLQQTTSGGNTTFSGTVDDALYEGNTGVAGSGDKKDLAFGTVIENVQSFVMVLRNGGTNTTFTIDAKDTNFIPGSTYASVDTGSTDEATPLVVSAPGLLSNDTDADGDTLIISQVQGSNANVAVPVTLPSGAIVTVNANGSYTYNPNGAFNSLNAGQTATDQFVYQISDGNGGFDLGTATITINGITNVVVIDTDSDGIANVIDIDDDNDGIVDLTEMPLDYSGLIARWTSNNGDGGVGGHLNAGGIDAAFVQNVSAVTPGAGITVATDPANEAITMNGLNSATLADARINNDYYDLSFETLNDYGDLSSLALGIISNTAKFGYTITIEVSSDNFATPGSTLISTYTLPQDGGGGYIWNQFPSDFGFVFQPNTAYTVRTFVYANPVGNGGSANINDLHLFYNNRGNIDTDNDGLINSLDIDSDNDGITDNIEAQTTAGYIAPSGIGALMGDADNDGLDDVYDADDASILVAASIGLNPVNTDASATTSDTTPDYLDTDSDNDTVLDVAERGDTQPTTAVGVTADTDQDGLLDIFEAGTVSDGFDVNDSNLDVSGNFTLADTDNDTAANGTGAIALTADLDYRDNITAVTPLDTDSDGIADSTDIDDDNDGILDTVEDVGASVGNAQGGTGAFISVLHWVEWTNTNWTDGIDVGDKQVVTLSDGSVITLTVTAASASASDTYSPSSLATWPGARLQNLYGTGSNMSLYDNTLDTTPESVTFAISAVDVNGKPFNVDIAWSDAETSDNGETNAATTDGSAWQQIETDGTVNVIGVGTQTVTLKDTNLGLGVYRSDGVSQLILNTTSRTDGATGFQGFAFAIVRPTDTDGDGVSNSLDLDSDNDGITDNVEAQATAGYIAPLGTFNAQGLDNAYVATTGLTPVNTDGTDAVDYLDADSDNDTVLDVAERGDTQPTTAIGVTTDTDHDGLLDIFEASTVNDGFDVNDQNLIGAAFNLADTDTDKAGAVPMSKDLDYRDVPAANANPAALNDNYTTSKDSIGIILTPLALDTDIDASDTLSITSINGQAMPILGTAKIITVANGTVNVDTAGVITFIPAAGFTGTVSFPYVINDGKGGTATANEVINVILDTDSDGIANNIDIDDDNDGILDTVEGPARVSVGGQLEYFHNANGGTSTVGTTSSFGSAPNIGDIIANPGSSLLGAGLTAITGNNNSEWEYDLEGANAADLATAISNNDYVEVTFTTAAGAIAHINNMFHHLTPQIDGGSNLGNYKVAAYISSDSFTTSSVLYDPYQIVPTTNVAGTFTAQTAPSIYDNSLTPSTSYTIRFYLYDSQNANGAATFNDQFIQFTADSSSADFDNDGLINALDIDSDNDGITDNVEAQTTAAYKAPSGMGVAFVDANKDGLDDTYGVGLTPVNTDASATNSDTTPDYLDGDSDGDAIPDSTERTGTAVTNTSTVDTDQDGLLDKFEGTSTTDGFNVNDENLNGTTFNLADSDSDTATDGAGAVPLTADLDYRDNVAPVNNTAPINTLPGLVNGDVAYTTAFNTDVALTGLSIADTDAASGVITVTLNVATGMLTASSTGTVTASGTGTNTVVLTGTLSHINTYLANSANAPVYTPVVGASGNIVFTMTTDDAGNTGTDPGLTGTPTSEADIDTRVITVQAANLPPVPTVDSYNTGVNEPVELTNISFADPDALASDVRVTLSVDAGTLNLLDNLPLGLTPAQITGNGTGTIIITAPLSVINDTLAAAGGLMYTPVLNSDLDHVLTATINDLGGVTGVQLTAVTAADIIVTNKEPLAVADTAMAIEAGALITGNVMTDALTGDDKGDLTTIITAANQGGTSITIGMAFTTSNGGILLLKTDGSYDYTPPPQGKVPVAGLTEVFNYTITDVNGDTSSATLTIDVSNVNAAPVGADKTVTINEDSTYTVTGADFGFSDPLDTPANLFLNVIIDSLPAPTQGVYLLNGAPIAVGEVISVADITAGKLVFDPADNLNGTGLGALGFKVQDDGGATNGGIDTSALVKVLNFDITPVNDAPIGADKTVAINEDANYTLTVADFGFSDPLDTPANLFLNVVIGSLPVSTEGVYLLNGTPVAVGDIIGVADIIAGKLVFDPADNVNGTGLGALGFKVQDDGGVANSGVDIDTTANVLNFNITPVNDAPVDLDESSSVIEDQTLTVPAATGLLANSTDVDGLIPTVTDFTVNGTTYPVTVGAPGVATLAGVGVLTINTDGSYSFAPAPDYDGTIPPVNYTINDNSGLPNATNTSTLTLVMVPVNDAPVDLNESNVVTEDQTLVVPAATGLLVNSTDVDGLIPTVTDFTVNGITYQVIPGVPSVATLASGDLTINSDGGYSFKPTTNYNGIVPVVTYTINDNSGLPNATDTSTLTLIMAVVNDAPIDGDEVNGVTEDQTLIVPKATGLLANSTDIDGLLPSVTDFTVNGTTYPVSAGVPGVATLPGVGVLIINSDGSYSFAPVPDYAGAIPPVTYSINDNSGLPNAIDISTLTLAMVSVNDAPVGTDKQSLSMKTLTIP